MATPSMYREAWQTWRLVRRGTGGPAGEARPDAAPRPRATSHEQAEASWRHRVQIARVDRQWSIAELAAHVQCDVETLASFECGDALLDEPVRRRLAAALALA